MNIHRIHIRGASMDDMEFVRRVCRMKLQEVVSCLLGQVENLRENLPLDEAALLEWDDLRAGLADIESDMDGRFQKALDYRQGNWS